MIELTGKMDLFLLKGYILDNFFFHAILDIDVDNTDCNLNEIYKG